MMLYFLNSRIPIEIETYGDYLWLQSKFHQDCCLIVFEPSSKVDRIFGSIGIVLDSYSRTLFCPGSPSRKMLVWVHQASSLNGESRLCVCGILASFDDSLCTYGNSAAKNCYSIHYMYSLHWVLTIFFCNQCVLLYILRICCCWRVCWIASPLHCFESFSSSGWINESMFLISK